MAFENPNGKPMSQINVTPLVDVMLVLLIIFMVTAPMLQQGVSVKLPKASMGPLETREQPLVVTITRTGKTFLNRHPYSLSHLTRTLEAIHRREPAKGIFLRADESVSYGYVIKTMAAIKKAGVEKIGMVTEIENSERPVARKSGRSR